jgi:hypothetical protein
MFIVEVATGRRQDVTIGPIKDPDRRLLTKARFAFNWKNETNVYELRLSAGNNILGAMSIEIVPVESRIEIKLRAVSKENVGNEKVYDRIAGNLLAAAARIAVREFGADAAINLIPKTELGQHYMDAYGFEQAGRSLFLEGKQLINLIDTYT